MGLFKKKTPKTTGRQRHIQQADKQSAPSLAYYSRRSNEDVKTGRKLSLRGAKKPAVGTLARYWLQRFGLLALIIAVLVCMISVLSLSNDAHVLSVDDSANSFFLHDQQTYEAAASKLMAGSIWNRNKITVDTAKVERQLQTQFPEISSVSVTLPMVGHRPIVYVQTTQPAIVLVSGGTSYVVDTNGRVLLKTNDAGSLVRLKLPVVTDDSGINTKIGRLALANTSVNFIDTVVAQLKAKGQSVETLTLPVGTSQLDVKVAGQPYIIKFNLQDSNARRQVGTYLATMDWLKSKNSTPSKYIDVRVEGRSYYQ